MFQQSPTIDKKQNSYFTRNCNLWWDTNGPFKQLQIKCAIEVEYIKELLIDKGWAKTENEQFILLKDLNILDAGCGGGFVAEPLARIGCNVLGIDVNEDMINVAMDHAKQDPALENLSYHLETIEDHAVAHIEKYDVVVLSFVLHHSLHHDILLEHCAQMLKPGGLIIITAATKTLAGWFNLILLGDFIFKYVPHGSHNWHRFIKPEDVSDILKKTIVLQAHPRVSMSVFEHWKLQYPIKLKDIILCTRPRTTSKPNLKFWKAYNLWCT